MKKNELMIVFTGGNWLYVKTEKNTIEEAMAEFRATCEKVGFNDDNMHIKKIALRDAEMDDIETRDFDTENRATYILSFSNGYELPTAFGTLEETQDVMKKAYQKYIPHEWDEEWKEMSYCGSHDAILYANGEDVLVWKIAKI